MTKFDQAIIVKVTLELQRAFDDIVNACGSTRSELIREVLELFVERHRQCLSNRELESLNSTKEVCR